MRFIRHCAGLVVFFSTGLAANPLIEQLIGTTEAFLEEQAEQHVSSSTRDARYEVEVGRLDPRLRLPLCPAESLVPTLESPAVPVGRVTVRVSCESDSVRWRLFVPAKVSLFEQVLVTKRPLARHEVLQAADITFMERDVGLLGDQYLTDPTLALGKRAKRQLSGDMVIGAKHLENDEIVKRGDKVVISAANTQISVRMPGEALQAGTVGSQIRVRNTRSGRVVTARVIGPGQVEVAM